jgi:plastocyanin
VAIAYRNIAISPADVTVRVGSVLTWTNDDNSVEHNVTSGSAAVQAIASPDLRTGQSFSLRVTKPGVISYKCTFHPASMVGRITVVP